MLGARSIPFARCSARADLAPLAPALQTARSSSPPRSHSTRPMATTGAPSPSRRCVPRVRALAVVCAAATWPLTSSLPCAGASLGRARRDQPAAPGRPAGRALAVPAGPPPSSRPPLGPLRRQPQPPAPGAHARPPRPPPRLPQARRLPAAAPARQPRPVPHQHVLHAALRAGLDRRRGAFLARPLASSGCWADHPVWPFFSRRRRSTSMRRRTESVRPCSTLPPPRPRPPS